MIEIYALRVGVFQRVKIGISLEAYLEGPDILRKIKDSIEL
jgi:hypothetical protein